MSAARALSLALLLTACAAEAPPARAPSPLDPQGVNDGVECVRYSFAADAPSVEAVAASFGTRPFPAPMERARLGEQGLQAAIVRTTDLDAVRGRLGTVTEMFRLPIGQSPTWAQLVRRDLGPGERIAGSTSLRNAQGATLRLSLRSWLVPDAQGGCAQVEVIAHVAGPEVPLNARAGEAPMGTALVDTFVTCRLQQGETLLLLPRPAPPSGKGPATAADLPPTAGMLLLGEPLRQLPDGVPRGYASVLAISATVPAAITPPPAAVDSPAPIADTTDTPPAAP
jgi:hypothetical protein